MTETGKRFSVVLFDFGDTLWHFPEPTHLDVIFQETARRIDNLFKSWDLQLPNGVESIGPSIRHAVEKEEGEADRGDLRSPDYIDLARRIASEGGLSLSRTQSEELWHSYNLGGPFLGRRLFENSIETLSSLRSKGYRIGAVTDRALGGTPFMNELRHHNLLEFFEVVSISADVGWRKPHAKIFQHALNAMKVAPEECVMVGDSFSADIAGAKALGMTAVLIRAVAKRSWENAEAVSSADADSPVHLSKEVKPDYIIDEIGMLLQLPFIIEADLKGC